HGSLPLHFYIFTFSTGGHPSSPGSASSALSASSAVSEANDAKLGKQKHRSKDFSDMHLIAQKQLSIGKMPFNRKLSIGK
ncbi:MAG: hypothetical protein IKI48_07035, partial [Prevotella sp.]|nr:hypothetical protein [Prevotella sp.]